MPKRTTRLHLELSEKAATSLEWLETELGMRTHAEVLRTALQTLAFLVSERKGGARFLVERDGERREVLLPAFPDVKSG